MSSQLRFFTLTFYYLLVIMGPICFIAIVIQLLMVLNILQCADVPLRSWSLTHAELIGWSLKTSHCFQNSKKKRDSWRFLTGCTRFQCLPLNSLRHFVIMIRTYLRLSGLVCKTACHSVTNDCDRHNCVQCPVLIVNITAGQVYESEFIQCQQQVKCVAYHNTLAVSTMT